MDALHRTGSQTRPQCQESETTKSFPSRPLKLQIDRVNKQIDCHHSYISRKACFLSPKLHLRCPFTAELVLYIVEYSSHFEGPNFHPTSSILTPQEVYLNLGSCPLHTSLVLPPA